MGLSENIYNPVCTVNAYFIAIRVFNAHDSEAMQSVLPRHVSKVGLFKRSLKASESAERALRWASYCSDDGQNRLDL